LKRGDLYPCCFSEAYVIDISYVIAKGNHQDTSDETLISLPPQPYLVVRELSGKVLPGLRLDALASPDGLLVAVRPDPAPAAVRALMVGFPLAAVGPVG
jgi:hypothetical protein